MMDFEAALIKTITVLVMTALVILIIAGLVVFVISNPVFVIFFTGSVLSALVIAYIVMKISNYKERRKK
jgi:uncharacterized membrane protein YesL